MTKEQIKEYGMGPTPEQCAIMELEEEVHLLNKRLEALTNTVDELFKQIISTKVTYENNKN